MASKDPHWKRDELILALDLYMDVKSTPDKNDPRVLELSDMLRRLPVHPKAIRTGKFRSPNSVAMKCGNFQYLDPDVPGGLPAGSKLDEETWNEFRNKRAELHELAVHLKKVLSADFANLENIAEAVSPDEAETIEVKEGETLYRLHRYKERNSMIVKRKKETILNRFGRLRCEVCGFDFAEVYGSFGEGYIECHHTKPLSTLTVGEKTKMEDLALVCANCHRMLHRNGVVTLDKLRAIRDVQ